MVFLFTGQVADLLKIHPHRLEYLTRDRQVRPRKGASGAFLWSHDDVVRASRLLRLTAPSELAFREAAVGATP